MLFFSGISSTLLSLWSAKADPYLQAQFFLVTLGGALSPQLLKPCLRNMVNSGISTAESSTVLYNTSDFHHPTVKLLENKSIMLLDTDTVVNFEIRGEDSKIQYCYGSVFLVMGILSLINIAVFASEGCKFGERNSRANSQYTKKGFIEGKDKLILLLMFFLQSFMFGGIEDTFSSLLMTFTVQYLNASHTIASNMTTLLWLSVTVSRGLGIVSSKYMRATKLLAVQLVTLLAVTLTLAFALNLHWIVPWLCVATVGLSSGGILPNLMSWANGCILLKGKETAVFLAGASFGKMIGTPLIGYLFDVHHPMWFVYITLIYTVIFIVLYLLTLILVYYLSQKQKGTEKLNQTEGSADLL